MAEHESPQSKSHVNRIPGEHIQIMSWLMLPPKSMGQNLVVNLFAESLRYVDHQCFGAKMAYEKEFLRTEALENHGNLWFAVNLFPKKGTPFDVGNVVGYILSSRGHTSGPFRVPNNEGYIDSLAVLPEAQGQGLGMRLRERAFEHWLDLFKFETVHTLARPDNEPMIKLNKRMGLIAVEDLKPGLYADGKPRKHFILTQQAWKAHKQKYPNRDWHPELGESTDPRFSHKVIRQKFDP